MAARFRQMRKLLLVPIILIVSAGAAQAQSVPACLAQANFSATPIPSTELIGARQDIAVRSDQGNLALLTVTGGANLVLIRALDVFDANGQKLDVQRQAFSIANGQRYNVDTGAQTPDGADLFWNVLGDVRQLEPANGAQIYLCPVLPVVPFAPTPVAELPVCLQQSTFSSDPIPEASVADAEVAVRTDQGNLALLKVRHGTPVEQNGGQFFELIVDNLQLFNGAGQTRLLSAQNLTIASTASMDVDNGVSKGTGTDIFWQRAESYMLTPRNGAQVYLCDSNPQPPQPPTPPAPQPPETPTPPAPQPPTPPQASPPTTDETINEIIGGD